MSHPRPAALPRVAARLAPAVLALALLNLPSTATAQTNLALGKATFASSACCGGPENAVDGNTGGDAFTDGIFHSDIGPREWWYVDLGASYDIGSIVFWNRTDCCASRIIGATLGIFTETPYTDPAAAPVQTFAFTSDETTQTFTPAAGTRTGRYVGIQQSGDYLQIAELQVFEAAVAPNVVPEPGTWALLGTGLLGVGGVARRRRTRVA